jgi:hypothetical protein
MKCCFVAETDFWRECFIFCNMVHCVPTEFRTYHSVIWFYVLQHLQLVREESKAFLKNFPHTRFWYIQLVACQHVDFLNFAVKPAEHNQLFPYSYLVSLNSSP